MILALTIVPTFFLTNVYTIMNEIQYTIILLKSQYSYHRISHNT